MSRTVAALYDSRGEAELARSRLLSEAGARSPRILARDTVGALEGMNIPAADAKAYRESLRQGCHLVVAEVPRGSDPKRIVEILQQATGASANDQPDNSWGDGEQGIHVALPGEPHPEVVQDAAPEPAAEPPAQQELVPASLPAPQAEPPAKQEVVAALPEPEISQPSGSREEERMPVAEEEVRVGERRIVAAGPRLRALTVEGPAEEEISLTDEFVEVESRPIQRELSESEVQASGLFTDRVFEVAEMREEPVVTKTAVVREEVIIRKRVSEHVETVRDTVRHTKIEVEDLPAPAA